MGKRDIELKIGLHNHFDFEVVDIRTGKVKQKAQAFNVICNSAFNRILNVSGTYGSANSIAIGKGTGTPAATDTALFSYLGTALADSTYSPYDTFDTSREYEGVWVRRLKRTITNAQFVGENITEVGLGDTRIFTHAMLQDMNGNPISIQHTNTDVINVVCTLYMHYSGQNSNIHLRHRTGSWGSTSYYGMIYNILNYFIAGSMNAMWGSNGSMQYQKQLEDVYCPSTGITYDVSNKKITQVFNQMPIGTGNVCKGFSCLLFHGANISWDEVCVENITPYAITDESVGIGDGSTTKFKTKFSYPTNATVYINGVAQGSGVTVKKWLPYPNKGDLCNAWVGAYDSSGNSSSVIPNVDVQGRGTFFVRLVDPRNLNLPKMDIYPYAVLNDMIVVEDLMSDVGIIQMGSDSYYDQYIIEGSDDGTTWVALAHGRQNTPYHYKYYRTNYHPNSDWGGMEIYRPAYDGYNIIFDNPPASGDVVTIDYTTDYIPKDSGHVLDVELTFTFGEWTGE